MMVGLQLNDSHLATGGLAISDNCSVDAFQDGRDDRLCEIIKKLFGGSILVINVIYRKIRSVSKKIESKMEDSDFKNAAPSKHSPFR